MIAGIVVTLSDDIGQLKSTVDEIASTSQIEVGEYSMLDRKFPLIIDAPNRHDVEKVTEWLQERHGVSFVDVVFVHFDEQEESTVNA